MPKVINFYVDDSGARHPGRPENQTWNDHCHWFALGGVLILESDETTAREQIHAFRSRWPQIGTAPLHSYEIRNRRDAFHWLEVSTRRDSDRFYADLESLILGLPILGLACVVDGPGYNARCHVKYGNDRWMMCKTAFAIAVERAAKHALASSAKLRVLVERSAKSVERDLEGYYKSLKVDGHPFDAGRAGDYVPLDNQDYSGVLYEFVTKKKSSPIMQIADLVLWPLCRAGYEDTYRPYRELKATGRLLDCLYPGREEALGTKYSCFDLWRADHPKQSPA